VPEPPTPTLSTEEFARLYQQHARELWCIAAGVLGDRDRAQDVLQDSSITALRRLEQFRAGTSFRAWMGQIVRFTALNELRKLKPSNATGDMLVTIPSSGRENPAPATEDFDDRVLRALRTLEPIPRACLLMKTVMDMPYSRISEMLDIPEGTAMSHVHRARASLRGQLGASHGGIRAGLGGGH
jgi:RNA polymerase sigma-70 factor (ECF subfamily)